MTLLEHQFKFSRMVCELLMKVQELGFNATLGDAFRDQRLHGPLGTKLGYGHPKSCHKIRLAIDVNLFRGNVYLTDTKDYETLGIWWESVGGTWGGRFQDGNHFSLSYNGMK